MTDKEKLDAVRAEIHRLVDVRGYDRGMANDLFAFMDSLPNEPVSVWHDANHQPTMYRKYLVRYSDGRVSGSWERHDNGFIPWKDVVKEHGFTHWCYVEDLLKL